jgi:hypothetical protein
MMVAAIIALLVPVFYTSIVNVNSKEIDTATLENYLVTNPI